MGGEILIGHLAEGRRAVGAAGLTLDKRIDLVVDDALAQRADRAAMRPAKPAR
jgi:hypothetical protein